MSSDDDLARAMTHHRAGELGPAEALYRKALQRAPLNPGILHNLGLLLAAKGELAGAAELIGRAIGVRSNVAELHADLGNVLLALERFADAARSYERALALKPGIGRTAYNLAVALGRLGRAVEAERWYRRAAEIEPRFWPTFHNLGNLLDAQERIEDSLPWYERAAALAPDVATTHYHLGRAFKQLGRDGDAERCYRRALALDPALAETHLNLSLCLLGRGAFAEGWPEWAWRHRTVEEPPRRFACPVWQGEPLAGRRLLVSAEQGIGDQILYAGLLPELLRRDGTIVVECETRLVPLFRRSFPAAEVHAHRTPPEIPGGFDCEIPYGSLGQILRPDFQSFANAPSRYLAADPAQIAATRARHAALGHGPRIGLSWRSRRAEYAIAKSSELPSWAPILAKRDAVLVDLQYGDTAAERAQAESTLAVKIHHDDAIDQMTNMDAFAAQIAALDLVITVSNTTAHVAGALGVPTWVLLPHGKGLHWYWFTGRSDSPWYPSLRLFRQDRRGDWTQAIANVAAALDEALAAGRFAARGGAP